jgi:hypothetical protein
VTFLIPGWSCFIPWRKESLKTVITEQTDYAGFPYPVYELFTKDFIKTERMGFGEFPNN